MKNYFLMLCITLLAISLVAQPSMTESALSYIGLSVPEVYYEGELDMGVPIDRLKGTYVATILTNGHRASKKIFIP